MEHFFREERFYTDLDDLMDDCDINEENINELEDDWSLEVEDSKLEKIFTLTEDFVIDSIIEDTDRWEDRFPEESERTFQKIKKAIKQSIDINKMNELLPSLYYPNGEKFTIKKSDLVEYLK